MEDGSLLERGRVIRLLKEFFEKVEEVEFAVIYGSVARGDVAPASDVDVAVKFRSAVAREVVVDLLTEVAGVLGVVEDKVDLLVVDEKLPVELLFKVVCDGIFLAGDREAYKRFRDRVVSMYLDFKLFREKMKLRERYLQFLEAEKGRLSGLG